MLLIRSVLLTCLVSAVFVASAYCGDTAANYLSKDGTLAENLEIFDLQGGIAGFTGTFVIVHKDGTWRAGQMLLEKMSEERSGKIGKDEMAKLAQAMAANNFSKLESAGEADVNPHVVTIRFGKASSTLTLPAGKPLPKADAKGGKTAEQRYAAIIETARELTNKK